ncbi:uncharacterized protein LOC5516654 isoform X3 [Nematostella vectensis]|uniref:uncharacterized protein LOC5516654 isoform X3 n=1 Tax=Nematostella vectensis TaxID=45351 RepID=UPI0020771A6D|nr:uncharacterized protein LOC5516654 isoform X3 [Nematostella vectensis]
MSIYLDEYGHAHRCYDEYDENQYSYSDDDYFDNYDDDDFDDSYYPAYGRRSLSPPPKALPTLVDSCCKILSANFPISYVQDQWKTVPDELQLKVISSSFPAEFPATVGSSNSDSSNRSYCIPTIIQTGCEIRATVMDNYVTIHFDRGKFTSVDCTCNYHKNRAEDDPMNRWCAHVRKAVAMRINYPEKIKYYLSPINESLQKLDRMKLLKLTGSLLNQYTNNPVVDSAQEHLDQLFNKSKNSEAFIDVSGNPIPSASPFVACSSSSSGFDSVTPFSSSLSSKGFKMYHDLKDNSTSSLKQTTVKEACVRSLVDCCCNVLSANFSISYVQDQWKTVPDELQLKVISSSFPVDKEKVMKIANFGRKEHMYGSYSDPLEAMFKPKNIRDMKQIGCRLSAKVAGFHFVTIFFDRRKITSAHCSCQSQRPWCQHVQETALERIRHPERATYHLPITDSLYQLNRDELLKLASMLLNYPDEIEMVDNAFQLMDKLLNKNGQHCHAEINVMDGVPDATAGPGVDEESHWVISKADISQFFIATYRLEKPLIPEIKISSNTPASPSYTQESQEPQEETRHCKRPFRISSPVIKGTCTKHFRSSHFLPTKLLDTVYSLLYEDIDEVLFIMTKTLVDHLENNKWTWRTASLYLSTENENDFAKLSWRKESLDLHITSLAMSFTATPFSCGTLCDELSRLWLLVVLNPKMSHRKKEVLTGWLEELDLEICRVFKDKHLLPWIGVEIALNVLRNVDLTRDELRCITNEDVPLATVSAVKMVQFNLQKSDVEPNEQRVRQPHTIRIGTVDLEIQTWCAIIQALQFRQCDAAATNLAFEISAALVSCFLGQILGHCDTDKLPFTLCDLAGRSDSKSYSLEAMEDEKESKRPEPIWPRDTIVDVSTFAFLFDVLSVDERLTQAAFAHHRKCILKRPDHDEEAMRGIHSGNEIRDLIGLIGLFLPRVPLPLTDTDQFDADNWLAVQLMSRPITLNWMVLCQIAQFVRDHTAHWYLAPPSSLIRVILYHAPSDAETLKLVLGPVLCCLSFPCPKAAETKYLVLLNSLNSQLVEELAVLAILRLSDYVDLQKILDAIFTQNGYLREKLFNIAKSLRIRMLHSPISVQCDTDRLSYVARALKVKKSEITLRSYSPDHDNQAKEQKLMRPIFELLTDRLSYLARALKVKKSEITLRSYCPDHDIQAEKQKLMRPIFKLSEHSLRLSKSCKGYSRSNDLSWLTERVLEMGEQGFSFFLTCLGGDLSEMITAGEAFQMCEKFLEKFKIFFPLDAPNKKTPDRPEGATALVNGILELFTDVAYKNSNWSEIELCISSMSSSLVPWMAQHLRVIAPDKQVPSSILLSTSEKTFNYFKQNFRSSRVFSMSLQQDVYDNTIPPLVDLAFDLGVLGLKAFSSESRTDDDTTDKMRSYISNFCDHDNQADEQKLMRLIFKLSELSLRLSKSCKGYSRSNDLSWLTERVLEMGEQGFSFFLTCLCGDLSEMITAREAFQMCEKFLEKFKIFFPLDAPNKKTPDRPEGATALVNGILELFTDEAYKNSNWSEIELHISSMSSSLVPWMAQHLRVIAPDKQVPSSILLSTSEKTFNYFKQNFRSSRVFSMSLQQDVYENTIPPLVDLAFDLGVLGLKAFSSESRTDDDTTDKMRSYISNFCDQDNQADEQKLMRLIFKLSELSLRLSKSCKGYSRSNDLSWLTERVLEMGEQGFSFFLTCLGGDLSEMLTAREAFQMCEKFLEKFKIFFPLDAPNKKTPDRPEGATALFNGILEPFTDVAYKNSNWSEIELCISSMSSSLFLWMAQHLRVIAPDKQVPSSILLSTSKKTFNYFKQNFQSSRVFSMSLQQDVYEDTTPLLVDLAFDLGVLGLKAFSSESRTDDDTTDKMRSYISNFCDHDNQADEQKLMRLIFKLSELSLRLSKSCKGYSRFNDLSWLTERVLEMGEQGFSFFLTCLCGDLSEMITAGEAFQMCEKFLEKFKIFFPLDAPNKKTPDRPEGATALFTSVLEPFTDVAYKNSNWSEIELCISSMSYSLVTWMAQYLRVIAPDKQVPSSILLSTSKKTFNYFKQISTAFANSKQNFQSSSVEEEDGSMSLQQDVYEDTTPLLVDLAFDLGVLGLKAFSSESRTDDDTTDKMRSYISNFCDQDNQADEQKLMRLIFKLSELSLRLSKSCKEYSRSNDLSWLTERVLEMGEQGFSFFLTCLCGDLSEMITVEESFQMCKKFLEKFKIFFPLDAPNKKTPDRPEGATALVNGILEPFTDVAYKNSNWSEIELHISSISV